MSQLNFFFPLSHSPGCLIKLLSIRWLWSYTNSGLLGQANQTVLVEWNVKIDIKIASCLVSFSHCLFVRSFKLLPPCGHSWLLSQEAGLTLLNSEPTRIYCESQFHGHVHVLGQWKSWEISSFCICFCMCIVDKTFLVETED